MIYLYLDESGDLGFEFVNRKPSKYFTICILAIQNKQDKILIERAVKRTLHNKINRGKKKNQMAEELKATSTRIEIKKYYFNQLKDIDFSIYALTLDKVNVFHSLVKSKPRVYNWISRLILEKIELRHINDRIIFTLDKSKGARGIREFNMYIQQHLESETNPKVPIDIFHKNSKEIKCIQATDLFAWGIRRKYENKDFEWYNVFKDKIKYDEIYLP